MAKVGAVENLQVKVDRVPALYNQVRPVSDQARKLLEDPGSGAADPLRR